MPRVDEFLRKIGQAKCITTLDLCKGYWQVPLSPASRPYTAFRTPLGLYQFTVFPFGLHGASATFQRFMNISVRLCISGHVTHSQHTLYDVSAKQKERAASIYDVTYCAATAQSMWRSAKPLFVNNVLFFCVCQYVEIKF